MIGSNKTFCMLYILTNTKLMTNTIIMADSISIPRNSIVCNKDNSKACNIQYAICASQCYFVVVTNVAVTNDKHYADKKNKISQKDHILVCC